MDLDINALYPPVQYPVSRGTPNLAELATWDHSEKFFQFVEGLSQMVICNCNNSFSIQVFISGIDLFIFLIHHFY